MQTRHGKRQLMLFIHCMMLIVVIALFTTGCYGKVESKKAPAGESAGTLPGGSNGQTKSGQLGEGSRVFSLTVTDREGNETEFEIHTDRETVGEALLELGLIDGSVGEYGLYVTTVNGITIDYDTDGAYWAFYINDEYATTGVDSTVITDNDRYSFRVE